MDFDSNDKTLVDFIIQTMDFGSNYKTLVDFIKSTLHTPKARRGPKELEIDALTNELCASHWRVRASVKTQRMGILSYPHARVKSRAQRLKHEIPAIVKCGILC